MLGQMIVLRIVIFCCSHAGDSSKATLCLLIGAMVFLSIWPILGMRLVGFLSVCVWFIL